MDILVVWVFTFQTMVGGYEGMYAKDVDGRVAMPTQALCEAVRTDLIEMDQVGYGAVTQSSAGLCVLVPDTANEDDIPIHIDRGAKRGGY